MRLGVINLPRSSRESVKAAQAAEAACFAATKRLRIGPTVTNTVTRHWSVLGATARTFSELYPGLGAARRRGGRAGGH